MRSHLSNIDICALLLVSYLVRLFMCVHVWGVGVGWGLGVGGFVQVHMCQRVQDYYPLANLLYLEFLLLIWKSLKHLELNSVQNYRYGSIAILLFFCFRYPRLFCFPIMRKISFLKIEIYEKFCRNSCGHSIEASNCFWYYGPISCF